METLFVTGGNGFIGSHMCRLLHENGFRVINIDNCTTSSNELTHSFGEFRLVDIASDAMLDLLKKEKPACVFHFAAHALVGESEQVPRKYYEDNIVKTLKLLLHCQEAGVKKFVFSSTCATFGVHDDPISEQSEQKPINTYGFSKYVLELVMKDMCRHGILDVVALRYFNVAGCSEDAIIGENHDPETHLIPNICLSHLGGEKVRLKVFGDKYPTHDGSCIRDYIHVIDLVETHLKAYEYIKNKSGFFDFNLGSGNGSSVKEVVTAFEKVTGSKVDVEIAPARAGDPPSLIANSEKAKKELGFSTRFTLEESIKHTLSYFEKND